MLQIRRGDQFYASGDVDVARSRSLLKRLAAGYLIAAYCYMIYSVESQTGLGGYLMALQLERFGQAGFHSSALIGTVLLNLPVVAIMAILQKVKPELVEASRVPVSRPRTPSQISWKRVFAVSAVPLMLTVLAVPGSYLYERSRLQIEVFTVNLDDAKATVPHSAKMVELTGVAARQFAAAYRKGSGNQHVYVPITGSEWTPADPVRFVAHAELWNSGSSQSYVLPSELRESGLVSIRGELTRSLPVVIAREYRAKGLTLAPSCVVVDESAFPWAGASTMIPAITGMTGLGLTLLTLLVMILTRRSVNAVSR